ncbi:CarD family transcriptional regulator [Thermobrachium celere]|uniref:CarD-like transcriptional regulator n=1 Tax=Thermobrachium celere DSM 8682 TaxID=941824 RepID=R7RU34_9CLOT|nr:CarD family transcriptional regulator [Thermobrachium celere]CDF58926.1 CarD-like transcriptional regulator [Thermobrachium celere DSM 8682]
MFNIGDKIYHPKFGAGFIVNIEEKEIYKTVKRYYIIKFIIDDVEIMLPVDERNNIKIREVIKAEDVEKIFDVSNKKHSKLPSKWIDRLKIYDNVISKGDVFEIAQLILDIKALSKNKSLSSSEEKILDNCILLLSSEISIILDVSIDEAKQKIINNLLS